MRLARLLFGAALAACLGAGPFACSSNEATPRRHVDAPKDSGKKPDPDAHGDDGGALARDSGPATGQVYANTTDTLYLFEPFSRRLTSIGKFSCLDPGEAVIDIAVDRTNTMYATTFRRFLAVDQTTATCKEIAKAPDAMDYPNSLSFVPAGTVSASVETLVGYASTNGGVDSDVYVSIDTSSGVMTAIGALNPLGAATQYGSSGDLFSLLRDSNRTYLTIRNKDVDAAVATDSLCEINPSTGQILRVIGDTHQSHIFGLAYWAGKAYGFSDDGRATEIDVSNGSSTVLLTLTADGGAVPWYGAGVTTNAPIAP